MEQIPALSGGGALHSFDPGVSSLLGRSISGASSFLFLDQSSRSVLMSTSKYHRILKCWRHACQHVCNDFRLPCLMGLIRRIRQALSRFSNMPDFPVFSSVFNASFASVNIPMMAVWLSGLTGEERERFQMLRRKFSEVQVHHLEPQLRHGGSQAFSSFVLVPAPLSSILQASSAHTSVISIQRYPA